MTTQEIANKLVDMFNAGEMEKPYEELYNQDIISIEHEGNDDMSRCEGMAQVMKKSEWWHENFEVHSASMSQPVVADDYFSVSITMDTTHKPSGKREQMTELAVYKVQGGKIVYEEFFYAMPDAQ
ncbi:nuclear transport factor 2 family protein [Patescibacteria group bacterium]|nr:nuclear transport factor 2 family protein [Patescibacteria group bacterium]